MNYKIKKTNSNREEDWAFGIVKKDDRYLAKVSHTRTNNLRWGIVLCIVLLFLFFIRILYMQTLLADSFQEWSENNYLRVFNIPSPRGIIYDRTGIPLVQNVSENIVYIIPADIPKDEEIQKEIFTTLSLILQKDKQEIIDMVEKNKFSFTPIEIASSISHEEVVTLEESFKNIPAIFVSQKSIRNYTYDNLYSHILGYVAPLNEKNITEYLEQGYIRDERVGVAGLEKQYESVLRGKPSKKVIEINAQGEVINERSYEEGIPGNSIHTTLIDELQLFVNSITQATLESIGAKAAVVIVGNPRNGEIYSLISLPNFNHNIFSDGVKGEEVKLYESYINNENQPLLNRSIGGVYPPGSTYKIITASAVLEKSDEVTAETLVYAPAFFTIIDKYDASKNYVYKDWNPQGHGMIGIVDALAQSSDTYFYTVTGGFEEYHGIGIQNLIQYSAEYLLGKKVGIDIPGEVSGLLASPEWKEKVKGSQWFTGDTYNMSIGQGYLLTTPIQVHAMISIIANNGEFITPHLNQDTFAYTKKLPLKETTIETIKQGLHEVVYSSEGTAKFLQSLPFEVAGKTGTAQFNNNLQEHAWFVSFAPFENPEVAVTVLVEGGGQGSTNAVPIAKKILQFFFENKEKWNL